METDRKPQPKLEPESSQAQEPEAAADIIPIDEETGKPLAGVELAKWRRQRQVKAKASPLGSPSSSTTPAGRNPLTADLPEGTAIPLDPQTGEPLKGIALMKWKRVQKVKAGARAGGLPMTQEGAES